MTPKKNSEASPTKCQKYGCLKMDNINRHAKIKEEINQWAYPYTENYRQLKDAKSVRNSLSTGMSPLMGHPVQLVNLKIAYTQVTLSELSRFYLYI